MTSDRLRRRQPHPSRKQRLRPVHAALLAALALAGPAVDPAAAASTAGAGTAAAAGGFGKPFVIARPVAQDLIPVQLSFSPTNVPAAAFGVTTEDNTAVSSGQLSLGRARGGFSGARAIPKAQQVLAVAYRGPTLELLTGTSSSGQSCCSEVQAEPVATRGVGARHTVIAGLTGTTVGRLVPVGNQLLAAVAAEHGVWVAQSDGTGRFGPTRSLGPASSWPQALDATGLANGRTVVAWTARSSQFVAPTTIFSAEGTSTAAPQRAVAAIVRAPHEIDELAVAAHGAKPTIAWIESWYDSAGTFHSEAFAEDLAGAHIPRLLSSAGELASGLALASGSGGAQVVAFRACTQLGSCVVRAALRRGAVFGATATLGPIDAAELPAVAASDAGAALVGWIDNGSVRAAAVAPRASRWPAPATVSSTGFAANLTLAFAPAGSTALAAWTQGTVNQSLVGALYRR